MRRHALRDDQWDRMKDLLPGSEGWVGATAHDNRLFVEAVLYRYRAGIPWCDPPGAVRQPDLGPYAFLALGQIRRLGAGVPASRSGPRQ